MLRQKGKAGGLDYRVEYYHQFGEAGATANQRLAALYTAEAFSGDVDRDAYMFGIRVGKNIQECKIFTDHYVVVRPFVRNR